MVKMKEGEGFSILRWFDEKICVNCSKYKTARCYPSFTREKDNSTHVAYSPRCFEIFMEFKDDDKHEKYK